MARVMGVRALLAVALLGLAGCASTPPEHLELVIPERATLSAPSNVGRFLISAEAPLVRRFEWPHGSIVLRMTPRASRWYGELGADVGGLSEPSDVLDHAVIEEGQLYFHSVEELVHKHLVPNLSAPPEARKHWTSDGLSAWILLDKRGGFRILHIDIVQFCVNGAKPSNLPYADATVSIHLPSGRVTRSLPCHNPQPQDYYTTWLRDHDIEP